MHANNYEQLFKIVSSEDKENLKAFLIQEEAFLKKHLARGRHLVVEFPSWQFSLDSPDDLHAALEFLRDNRHVMA